MPVENTVEVRLHHVGTCIYKVVLDGDHRDIACVDDMIYALNRGVMVFGAVALHRKGLEKMNHAQLLPVVKNSLEAFCDVSEIGSVAITGPGAERTIVKRSRRDCVKKCGTGGKRVPGKTNKIHVP